eukprot:tig00000704_g3356.t1
MDDRTTISFDESYQIRILDPEKFKETERLQDECKAFVDKTSLFHEKVQSLLTSVEEFSQKIEKEKLKAIGLRNRVEGEAEARKRKRAEMQSQINEKTSELDRYIAEYESLVKVEQEQRILIERLNNNE